MATLSEIKTQAFIEQLQKRGEWLGEVKRVAAEVMPVFPFGEICIRFVPETRWASGEVVNGTLFIGGDWRALFGEHYAEAARELLESDPFFDGWRVDIGKYMNMRYLVVTEISRS